MDNPAQAIINFNRSYALEPTAIESAWMAVWAAMNMLRPEIETAEHLEMIAALDKKSYIAHICQGVALGLRGMAHEGLCEIECAIQQQPENYDAYFWRGLFLATSYQGDDDIKAAIAAIEQSLKKMLPSILLTPLYWLEKDKPEMFVYYLKPLLEKYGM